MRVNVRGLFLCLVSLLILSGCKISGTITYEGQGVEGIAVVLSGDASMTAVTDADGYYEFSDLEIGSYTVSPPDYDNLIPGAADVKISTGDIENLDFVLEEKVAVNGMTIRNQSDLEFFGGYTRVDGNLTIVNTDLVSLDGLECLHYVDDQLRIYDNRKLKDLDGLENLGYVHSMRISSNGVLSSMAPLKKLTRIDGDYNIFNNRSLKNLAGLENITQVDGTLRVSDNFLLENVDALSGFSVIGGDLELSRNENLENVDGLKNLKSVGGELKLSVTLSDLRFLTNLRHVGVLSVEDCDQLVNLSGLECLETLGGLLIANNDSLITFDGLPSFEILPKYLSIDLNPMLENIEVLSSLVEVGWLSIGRNASLTNLCGLRNLVSANHFGYWGNSTIQNFNDLVSLQYLEDLSIVGSNLSSLEGLENVSSVRQVYIGTNGNLVSLQGFPSMVESGGFVEIERNANLVNLSGMESVKSLEELVVEYNDGLQNFEGLSGLKYVRNARISRNASLQNFSGLESLESAGRFEIDGNDSLSSLVGLGSVSHFEGLHIYVTLSLESLSALESLERVGVLNVWGTLISDLGLDALSTVDYDFMIQSNSNLCTSRVEALRDQVLSCGGIGRDIIIRENKDC